MSVGLSIIIVFVVLFALIFFKIPIGWAMLVSGLVGFILYGVPERGFSLLGYTPWSVGSMEMLVCIPLYLLMGETLYRSGLTSRIFDLAINIVGKLKIKGGLAISLVVANAFFGALSGSTAAALGTFTPIVMPEATRYNYNKNFLGVVLAASASLSGIIPPSIILITFGFLTGTSIAKLFIAGIVPGVILATSYALAIYLRVTRNPSLAPYTPVTTSWRQIGRLFASNIPLAVLAMLVLGGIYLGWFTTTESAGVGAGLAFILAFALKKLSLNQGRESFLAAGKTVGLIFLMFIGARLLSSYIAVSQIGTLASEFIVNLGLSRYLFILALFILYFIMGTTLDPVAILFLTLPVITPVIEALDISLIWFAIFSNLTGQLAVLTPPVAMSVFMVEGIARDPKVTSVGMYMQVIPFLATISFVIVLITIFPELCTWLPGTMG